MPRTFWEWIPFPIAIGLNIVMVSSQQDGLPLSGSSDRLAP